MNDRHFDGIVIGSGIGGLAVASLLARLEGRCVLVLERHSVLGGLTQQFKRPDGRRFDVGVHYVGDVGEGAFGRAVFDYLSEGRLGWQRMSEPFERFVYPDFTFDVYGDERRYRADLVDAFPAELSAGARGSRT
jgi:all-trans-retinol 13,14-reductase